MLEFQLVAWDFSVHYFDAVRNALNTYAMTFDDGPTSHWAEVLDVLKAHDIKASFFVLGDHLGDPAGQDLLRRAYAEGQQISNHSFSHPDLMKESDESVLSQVQSTESAIVSILGSTPDVVRDARTVRPPFGYIDKRVQGILDAHGYRSVRWNSDRGDWDMGAEQAPLELARLDRHLAYFAAGPSNNSVIDLNHDFSGVTRQNLDEMIVRIKAAGYRIVRLSECRGLEAGTQSP